MHADLVDQAKAIDSKGQPAHFLQISNRAQQRLCRVHQEMRARGNPVT